MPRPRKPTEILEASGSFRTHPDRTRVSVQVNHDLGEPPAYLTPDEAEVWREIVSNAPVGVLSTSDITTLDTLANLVSRWRKHRLERPDGITVPELIHMRQILDSIGCTPSGRAKLAITVGSKKTQAIAKAQAEVGEASPLARFLRPHSINTPEIQ